MTNLKQETPKDARMGFAAAVARVVELDRVRVRKLSAEVFQEADELARRDMSLKIDQRHRYLFDDERGRLTVELHFNVSCAVDGAPSSKKKTDTPKEEALGVEVAFTLDYRLSVPPPPLEVRDQYFTAFAEINAAFNAWPYLREVVHNITARMGLPSLVLPVFRIPRANEAPATQQGRGEQPKESNETELSGTKGRATRKPKNG